MSDKLTQQVRWLADILAQSTRVACMTGAGISAESGVATFREAGGLWEGHRPEDVATPEAFARDADMVWRFYLARRQGLLDVKPNPAHHALVDLQEMCSQFDLITQNVDGLHDLAGSRDANKLHGDIWIDRCTKCGYEQRVDSVSETIPTCTMCGAVARPGVVWFGETLPVGAIDRAARAVAAAQVMLVVGTSSLVQPAASLSALAREAGARVVEFNIEETPLTGPGVELIRGKAGETLPAVVAEYKKLNG